MLVKEEERKDSKKVSK